MAITDNFKTAVLDVIQGLSAHDKTKFANLIWQNGIRNGELADRHTLVTDVRNGDPVIILDNKRNYKSFPASPDPKECGLNECDLEANFSTKTWSLFPYNCRVPICFKSFEQDFLYFFEDNYQVLHDLSLEERILVFLRDRFEDNMIGATWRMGYFGDTSIDALDPDYDYFRGVDGFFTQAQAGNGVKIGFNQVNPTGEDAYDALEEAYNEYMMSDWASEGVVWKMTRKMAGLLVRWLNGLKDKSQYNCECFSADGVTAMRTFTTNGSLLFFGIPVEIESDLDGVISQLAMDRPYRALLTYKNNLQIGVEKEDNIKQFDMWYDKKDLKVYIDGEFYFGAMIPEDNYVYVGADVSGS